MDGLRQNPTARYAIEGVRGALRGFYPHFDTSTRGADSRRNLLVSPDYAHSHFIFLFSQSYDARLVIRRLRNIHIYRAKEASGRAFTPRG